MVLDSGATTHFICTEENLPATGTSSKIVVLLDGSIIKATHTVNLPFPSLAATAREAHVLPSLATNSLISIPKLSNAGYTTVFHPGKCGVTVHRQNTYHFQQRCKPGSKGGETRMGCGDWVTNIVKVSGTYNQKAK